MVKQLTLEEKVNLTTGELLTSQWIKQSLI